MLTGETTYREMLKQACNTIKKQQESSLSSLYKLQWTHRKIAKILEPGEPAYTHTHTHAFTHPHICTHRRAHNLGTVKCESVPYLNTER